MLIAGEKRKCANTHSLAQLPAVSVNKNANSYKLCDTCAQPQVGRDQFRKHLKLKAKY